MVAPPHLPWTILAELDFAPPRSLCFVYFLVVAAMDLFGTSGASWHLDLWRAVDDRVRGGASQSFLEPCAADHALARFHGLLGQYLFNTQVQQLRLTITRQTSLRWAAQDSLRRSTTRQSHCLVPSLKASLS